MAKATVLLQSFRKALSTLATEGAKQACLATASGDPGNYGALRQCIEFSVEAASVGTTLSEQAY